MSPVSLPVDPLERLRLAEAELRGTWDRVRDWNTMGSSLASYDSVSEELSARFGRLSMLVSADETLCREIREVEESIRAALEPPRSSRDIRRGMSPGINLHFEFLLREIRRALTPATTATAAPPSSNPDGADNEEEEDDDVSASSSSGEDDGLHFPIDD